MHRRLKRKQRNGKSGQQRPKKLKMSFDGCTVKALGTSIAKAFKSANQQANGNGGEESKEDTDQALAQPARNRDNRAL